MFLKVLYNLSVNLAKAISMSSFVSCSVSGFSPVCSPKIGIDQTSFNAFCIISVYLLFFAVILVFLENKEFIY
jgi:hypothetical protein